MQAARDRAVGGWAFLKDRRWEEKASMGWFGLSTEGKRTEAQWYAWVWEQIQALPENARITIVDCHI